MNQGNLLSHQPGSRYPAFVEDLNLHPIIESSTFQRLAGIDFLGSFQKKDNNTLRSSRYDHSLGVAQLACDLSNRLEFDTRKKRTFVAAALLHDLGHMPFSHVTEPFFLETADVDHHDQTLEFLRGKLSPYGDSAEIPEAIREAGLNPKAVRRILRKDFNHPLSSLLRGPLNVDTIDGINRCAVSLDMDPVPAHRLLPAICEKDGHFFLNLDELDAIEEFWSLKDHVYTHYIYAADNSAEEQFWVSALHAAHENTGDGRKWRTLTDEALLGYLRRDSKASRIVEEIRQGLIQGITIDLTKCLGRRGDVAEKLTFDMESARENIRSSLDVEEDRLIMSITMVKRHYLEGPQQAALTMFMDGYEHLLPLSYAHTLMARKRTPQLVIGFGHNESPIPEEDIHKMALSEFTAVNRGDQGLDV